MVSPPQNRASHGVTKLFDFAVIVMFREPSYTFFEDVNLGVIEIVKVGVSQYPFSVNVRGGRLVFRDYSIY